jgi:hypothetical protein
MRNLIKALFTFVLLFVLLCACNKAEKLDEQKDYILIKAIKSAQNQSLVDIDVDDLGNYASICEQKGARGKYCLANALIGYKLYFEKDFDKSIIHLKKAEANLEYCDSIASFVYGYISNVASTTDTILALIYIDKAINKSIEYNDLKRLPYFYLNKSLLLQGDSAKFYLQKSLDLFDEWGDKIAKCRYANKHYYSMELDSVVAYILPYYDSISFTGYAVTLAEIYLKKGDIDSAQIYIDRIKAKKNLKELYYKYNSELVAIRGDYKEAYEWREMAHNQLSEDYKFMMNQRLGAINAEYDLLNVELQNEKKRVRLMGVYNVILVVLVALLIVAMVLMKRYKRDINVMEIDIAKRKERFNVLFEKHKSDYKLDKGSVMTDAMRNLEKLHGAYPTLTRTEVAIIWLLFMKCSTDSICEMLNITQNYYYQRKSAIYRTFGIRGKDEGEAAIERIVREYLFLNEE